MECTYLACVFQSHMKLEQIGAAGLVWLLLVLWQAACASQHVCGGSITPYRCLACDALPATYVVGEMGVKEWGRGGGSGQERKVGPSNK